MTIHFEPEPALERFVGELVASGRFASEHEVLREALRLFQDREAKLAALDAAIARGLADVAAGRVVSADAALAKLEAKYKALAESQSS